MLLSVSLSHPDCEPEEVSDWSFDENCLFCCLRRERVKVGVITTVIPPSEKPLWLWASLDGFNVLSEAGGWHLFRLTTLRSSVQAEPGWCGALLLLFHLISSGSWTSRIQASPKPRCHPVIQLAISTSLEPNCSDGDCVIDRGSASCKNMTRSTCFTVPETTTGSVLVENGSVCQLHTRHSYVLLRGGEHGKTVQIKKMNQLSK